MRYTLITKNGSVMQFYVEELANTYQIIHGGVVFTQQILVDNCQELDYTGLVD
jgi:hypothetical protein